MSHRSLTAVLAIGFVLGYSVAADAQLFRRLVDPEDRGRGSQNVNPEQEKKKVEADKANQAGDFAKAIELTEQVLRQDPRDAVAYYLRGSARVELGVRQGDAKMVREGVADSREAIRYDTKHTAMYYLPYLHGMKNLAILENRKEHAETAVTVAGQILGLAGVTNDDKANLLFQRAQAQSFLGKSDQAIVDLEESVKLVPTHFGARAALADVLAAAGKTDQAMAAFNKLVELFPQSPLSYNNRGMFLQHLEKFDEAIVDFTRAVERDPNYFVAYTNRGFTLLEMDNPAAAEGDFTQSLKINGQQPFLYKLRSLSKLARGDGDGAIADQRAAVDLNPRDPMAHEDLGFLLFFTNDFAGAAKEFSTALSIDAEFRHVEPWRIVALQRLGNAKDLKDEFKATLAKDPKQQDWIDHLIGYVLGAQSDAQLRAATGDDKNPTKNDQLCEAEYFIGLSKAASGKNAEALENFRKAVATKSRQLSAYRGAQFALKKAGPADSTAGVAIPSARNATKK